MFGLLFFKLVIGQDVLSCTSNTNCTFEWTSNITYSSITFTNSNVNIILIDQIGSLFTNVSGQILMQNSIVNIIPLQLTDVTYSYLCQILSNTIKLENTTLKSHPYLLLESQNDFKIQQNSFIVAPKVGLKSNKSIIIDNSNILGNISVCKGFCSCSTYSSCSRQALTDYISLQNLKDINVPSNINEYNITLKDFLVVNFSLVLFSNEIYLRNSTNIKSGSIGVYSVIIQLINASISTNGMGCSGNTGLGCGYLDWIIGLRLQCGGTGASHGGVGGFSTSQKNAYIWKCLQMRSRSIYGNPFNPLHEGSGGGAQWTHQQINSGNGGGVIYLESSILNLSNSSISSNGESYIYNRYYGSGSGGTVQLRTTNIISNIQSIISANGGGTKFENQAQYGGSGGGGRVLFLLYNQTQNETQNYLVEATFGNIPINLIELGNQINYNWTLNTGTVIGLPCPPTTSPDKLTQMCTFCPGGTYKMLWGFGQCLPCMNQIDHAIYNYSNSPTCSFICEESYEIVDGYCLNSYQRFMNNIGGRTGLFAILYFIILLLINIIIVWIRKQKKTSRDSKLSASSSLYEEYDGVLQQKDISSGIQFFTTQDLAYHIQRLYLAGCNTYDQPWKIYLSDLQKNNCLSEMCNKFNQKAQYTKCQKYIQLFFTFYYYPVFLMIQKYQRLSKKEELSDYFQIEKASCMDLSIENIKISTSNDLTLAYLDLLDYNRNYLEWSSVTQFPVQLVLVGTGTFVSPYQINAKDPVIKLLWMTFQRQIDYDESEDSGQSQDTSKNCIEIFVKQFNYFCRFIDFRSSRESFYKHFNNLIAFIDLYNDEIFSKRKKIKIRVQLCIHVISKDNKYKSKLIILNNDNERELRQCLLDIYQLQYCQLYELKFSLKIDELNYLYENQQIVLETKNNINSQIEDSKEMLDERHLFNNLKKKMIERIEQDQQYEIKARKKQWSYSFMDIFQQLEENGYQITFTQQFYSKFLWILSQITRYRQIKSNQYCYTSKVLQGILIFLALSEVILAVTYPLIIFQQLNQISIWVEFIFQIIFFPFSEFIAPFLLITWLLNQSKAVGKYYILFNVCAMMSSFIEFVFIAYEAFKSDHMWPLTLIKFIQIVFMVSSSHILCLQLNRQY